MFQKIQLLYSKLDFLKHFKSYIGSRANLMKNQVEKNILVKKIWF